jgi:hypothetical protein
MLLGDKLPFVNHTFRLRNFFSYRPKKPIFKPDIIFNFDNLKNNCLIKCATL